MCCNLNVLNIKHTIFLNKVQTEFVNRIEKTMQKGKVQQQQPYTLTDVDVQLTGLRELVWYV